MDLIVFTTNNFHWFLCISRSKKSAKISLYALQTLFEI